MKIRILAVAALSAFHVFAQPSQAAPVVTGSLTLTNKSQTVDLTAEGTTDWRFWGDSNNYDYYGSGSDPYGTNTATALNGLQYKAGVTSTISKLTSTDIGFGYHQTNSTLAEDKTPTFVWSDGGGSATSQHYVDAPNPSDPQVLVDGYAQGLAGDNSPYPWGRAGALSTTVTVGAGEFRVKVYVGNAGGGESGGTARLSVANASGTVLYASDDANSIADGTGNSNPAYAGLQGVYTLDVVNDTGSDLPLTVTWAQDVVQQNTYFSAHPVFDAVTVAAVPEPATLGLLSLAALPLLRRRRSR